MSEITKDFIRGVLAGRDYEREINEKEITPRTNHVREKAIKQILEFLEEKLVVIADVETKVSVNAKILLEYQRKIVHEIIKEVTELL